MADTKISALTAASAFDGSEVVPVVQGGVTKKVSVGSLGARIGGALADSVPFNYTQGATAWTNGPAGQTNYNDDVVAWGYNITAPNIKVVGTEPAGWFSFERKFYQSGRFVAEYHLSHNGTNNSEIRMWSYLAAHDGSYVFGMSTVSQLSFQGVTGGEFLQFDWRTAGQGRLKFANGTQIQAQTNNVAWAQQLNAAGSSYISMPFLNAQDRLQTSSPFYVANSNTAQPTLEVLPIGTFPTGSSAIYVNGGTSTGSLYCFNAVQNASTGVVANVQNNQNATNAKALLYLQALYGNSGCDVAVYFNNIGVGGTANDYTAGIDQSANAFKISKGSALGTNDRLIIDANTLTVALPLKLASYTAATLPSASTVGTFSTVGVTDANSTTARSTVAGGGSNKVLAFSDNTNWLIAA